MTEFLRTSLAKFKATAKYFYTCTYVSFLHAERNHRNLTSKFKNLTLWWLLNKNWYLGKFEHFDVFPGFSDKSPATLNSRNHFCAIIQWKIFVPSVQHLQVNISLGLTKRHFIRKIKLKTTWIFKSIDLQLIIC